MAIENSSSFWTISFHSKKIAVNVFSCTLWQKWTNTWAYTKSTSSFNLLSSWTTVNTLRPFLYLILLKSISATSKLRIWVPRHQIQFWYIRWWLSHGLHSWNWGLRKYWLRLLWPITIDWSTNWWTRPYTHGISDRWSIVTIHFWFKKYIWYLIIICIFKYPSYQYIEYSI